MLATVAIPVRNGACRLEQTLRAVRAQRLDGELELLVCDSGSDDGSVALARRYGAEVIEIEPAEFGHGRTRNLLMDRSRGEHVAFLTQDAVPGDEHWLSSLLGAFALAPRVGLAFGPYRPRPEASPSVARELTEWFASFSAGVSAGVSAGAAPRIDVLDSARRSAPPHDFLGHRGFFTDANGCVARAAWRRVPFRDVAYAEDHRLAQDMLRAGWAKVYVPTAAVIHSHDYSAGEWIRRSFDEARAMREVYGWARPSGVRATGLHVWGRVGADLRFSRAQRPGSTSGLGAISLLAHATVHHGARSLGAGLGARAQRLPAPVVKRLSLERRHR